VSALYEIAIAIHNNDRSLFRPQSEITLFLRTGNNKIAKTVGKCIPIKEPVLQEVEIVEINGEVRFLTEYFETVASGHGQ